MRVLVMGCAAAAAAMTGMHAAMAQPITAGPISQAELMTKARDACKSEPTFASDTFLRADMDGDGKTDVLFNWAGVTCANPPSALARKGAGNCGMHNCSVDVYLSSQYKPGGWPKPILNHMEIAPEILPAGTSAILRTSYQGGSCKFAEVCQREWRWNGAKFISEEVTASAASGAAPITQANLIGNWVDAADGCATDLSLSLRADGSYGSFEETGDWRLIGDRIAIVVRETFVMGDAGSERAVSDPKPVMLSVVSLTPNAMTVRRANGQETRFKRC